MRTRLHVIMTVAIVLCLFGVSATAWGDPLLVENFNYTVGSLLTANGWNAHSGAGTNSPVIVSPGLTYAGYLSSGGNCTLLLANGEDDNKTFTAQNSGSVYASAMINVTSTSTTGDYFFHFLTGTTSFTARLLVKEDASGNLSFGIYKGTLTSAVWTSYSYTLNTTYLVVIKHTFNTGSTTDDVVSLWINPALGTSEPTPTLTESDVSTDISQITAIALRQGTAGNAVNVLIGGIRVATTWSDVADVALPVEMTSFTATAQQANALLAWSTATEVNNFGFNIERRAIASSAWEKVGFVAGNGTSNATHNYTYADNNLSTGTYAYRIKQIDNDGTFKYSASTEVTVTGVPKELKLYGNYPNPFNPSTKVQFTVPENGNVRLSVYNVLGQAVATLFSGAAEAGNLYTTNFDASRMASGLYFSVLEFGNQRITQKMMLTK